MVGNMGKIPCFTNLRIWVRITSIHAKKPEVASRMPEDGIETGDIKGLLTCQVN